MAHRALAPMGPFGTPIRLKWRPAGVCGPGASLSPPILIYSGISARRSIVTRGGRRNGVSGQGYTTIIERVLMRNSRETNMSMWGMAGRCAVWLLVVNATLFMACAAPPEGAPPAVETAEIAVISESSPADATQDPTPASGSNAEQEKRGQAEPAAQAPKPDVEEGPKGNTAPARPTADAQPPLKLSEMQKAGQQPEKKAGCGAKGTMPQPSPDGPQPVYVCKPSNITADPVWRGETIDFVFNIKNEGEGNLQIQVKGG